MKAGTFARLLPAILLALPLSSCYDFFNSLFETAAPGSVSASDGKYANRIEVSWSEPDLSNEKWEGKSVTGYTVSWSAPGPVSGSDSTTSTSYSIPVLAADRAKLYVVQVVTEIDGSDEGSSGDTGFALETFDLLWYDGGKDYSFTASDRWYVTMLQKGFDYRFAFADGKTGWVEFYEYGTLDLLASAASEAAPVSEPVWTCDEDGDWSKFYVRVVPATAGATFRAGYGF
ncbi:MAG TPA: hypothetical protein DIC34_00970 [Treponema sp.]|nr:MAG: hypothetical protein A2001_03195 [Treponema sp. GWC1_61_84]HCM25116.1 hypothetical protein [Treponema sp.]